VAAIIDAPSEAPADARAPAPETWLKQQTPRWLVPVMAVLALAEAGAIVITAWCVAALAQAVFIDAASIAEQTGALRVLGAALLTRAGVVALRQYLAAGVSARIRQGLRRRLLRAIETAGPAAIDSGGQMVPVFDEQVEALDAYYSRFTVQRVAALLVPLAIVGFVFWQDWLAGLFLALSAPLIPLFMILVGLGAERRARDQHAALAQLTGWFSDQLGGAATIRLFGAEARALAHVAERTEALRTATMRVLRLAFLSSAVLEFFASVAIAAVAIYVGLGLLGAIGFGPADALTLQSGLFVLLLAPEFFAPLRSLSQGWHDRADARAAAGVIAGVLARPPARPAAEADFAPTPPARCPVRLDGVRFAHPGRAVLFDKLDLEIRAGQRVALIGPSGGGKSSLLALMAGFVEPDAGHVLLAGQPLARFSPASRSAHVAWLDQRPYLFAGTLADNLRLGKPDATQAELEAVAGLARVDEFADPRVGGLQRMIGEGGRGLSGGQAQRIALARALLRPRPLILLDEPTASLDFESEAEVLAALRGALDARPATVVCATHRDAMIDWADRVLEVDGGEVREVSR